MRVIICEDDKSQKLKIEKIVNKILKSENINGEIVLSTSRADELIKYISINNDNTLYFLDVDLNQDINGIELAKKINEIDENALIAMITSHEDMSYLTFKYHVGAIDYIIKDNFDEVEKRMRECIIYANSKFMSKDEKGYFIVNTSREVKKINYNDIIYFETSKKRVIGIHLVNSYIEFQGTMKDLEQNLDKRFIRCHRSYIVNKDKVKSIDKNKKTVYLEDGYKCFVSTLLIKRIILSLCKY